MIAQFYLFVETESYIQTFLGQKKANVSLLEHRFSEAIGEVQYQCFLLSQDIDDNDDCQALLLEIIKLWVNVRCHAIVASLMEEYNP